MSMITRIATHATWASSFRYREFRLLWSGMALFALGLGMELVTVGWLVLEITDSPFMVGVATAARSAPFVILGVLSGAIADRLERRLLLRFVALGACALAGLMALMLITDAAKVWYVIGVAFAMGGMSAINQTVGTSYTYDIVGPEGSLNGMSLVVLCSSVGMGIGAIVAGSVIAWKGPGGAYLVVVGTYFASFAILLPQRRLPRVSATQRSSMVQMLIGYVDLVRRNRTLLVLMFLAAITEIFGFTHKSMIPVLARDVLGVGPLGLGIMTSAGSVGGLVGLLILASVGDFRRKGLLMFVLSTALGLALMTFSLSANMLLYIIALAFVSACAYGTTTLHMTLMQSSVADDQRGRAMGLWILSIGMSPPGFLGLGGIASALGAPMALLMSGGALAFAGVTSAIGLPRMRRLE